MHPLKDVTLSGVESILEPASSAGCLLFLSSRSVRVTPAITSTADSKTMRYELAILKVPRRCTQIIRFLYFFCHKASAQISLPCTTMEWVTFIKSRCTIAVAPATLVKSVSIDDEMFPESHFAVEIAVSGISQKFWWLWFSYLPSSRPH